MMLFHGTTFNRFKQIMKDGALGIEGTTVWYPSESNTTYFYTEKHIKEEYGGDEIDEDTIISEGIRYALESANYGLMNEEQNLKRVVLVFDSEELEKIGELEPDNSCENMEYCLQFHGKLPVKYIKNIFIDRVDMTKFKLYYLGMTGDIRTHLNTDQVYRNEDAKIIEASQKLYKNEEFNCFYMETFDCIEAVEEITMQRLEVRINKGDIKE